MAEANGAAAGAANGSGGATNGAVVNGAAGGAANGAANGAGNGTAANGTSNGAGRHTSLADALGVDGNGAANGAANGQPNGQQPGQQPGMGHNGGPPFIPEGLPAEYRGTTDRETIERLAKDVGLVRRAPEKPEGYALKLEGEMAARYGDIDKDPVFPMVRKAAHAAGLDNAQFQKMFTGLYKDLRDGGLLEPTIDIEAEVKQLAPKAADPATAKAQAGARLNGVFSGVKALEARGVINKKGAEALQSAAATAAGAIALEAVLRMAGEQGVQVGGQPGNGAETREQTFALMKDERYSTTSPKYDPAFRKDVDERIRRAQPARR